MFSMQPDILLYKAALTDVCRWFRKYFNFNFIL